MLKVSKLAFLKEQIFVKENIENILTYLVRNVLFLKMKSSKLSNYLSLDVGGMEKCFFVSTFTCVQVDKCLGNRQSESTIALRHVKAINST